MSTPTATTQQVQGLAELQATLLGLPDKLRRRALRNALAAGARVVRDAARGLAPVLSASASAVRKGYRRPGTLKRAISVRTSKAAARQGDVGVFVNVRPAKGAQYRAARGKAGKQSSRARTLVRASQRGAKSPTDPYYWRFVEFGTTRSRQHSFLRAAAGKLGEALAIFTRVLAPQIVRLNITPKADL